MKKFKKGIIHIGTEKTGTTSIQESLALNRHLLAQHGICYPKALGDKNQIKLTVYACAKERIDQDIHRLCGVRNLHELHVFRLQLEKDLREELTQFEGERKLLLVSNEHAHSRLGTIEEVQRAVHLLRDYCECIEIIVYLRRQDRMAVSSYSTLVKCEGTRETVFIQKHDAGYESFIHIYCNYKGLIERWEKAVGTKNLIIRLFEKQELVHGDVVHDYFTAIGLSDIINKLQFPEQYENESLSANALNFLRAFNEYFPPVNNNPNPYRGNIIGILQKHFSGKDRKPSRQAAITFYQQFKADNNAVARLYLKRDFLFTEDFSDYPEIVDETAKLSDDELYKIAFAIWEEKQKQLLGLQQQLNEVTAEKLVAQARLLRAEQKQQQAEEKLLKAIQLLPRCLPAYRHLAELMVEKGQIKQAIDYLDKALQFEQPKPLIEFKERLLKKL